jgi:hypothetical protein
VRGSTVPVALEMVGESVFVSARDMMEIAVPVRFSTVPECGSIITNDDEMESGGWFEGSYMADLSRPRNMSPSIRPIERFRMR